MSKLLHSNIPIAQDSIQLIGNQTQRLEAVDLNDYTSGIACFVNCVNAPDESWYMLIATSADSTTCLQICFPFGASRMYKRIKAGNVWYSWEQLI